MESLFLQNVLIYLEFIVTLYDYNLLFEKKRAFKESVTVLLHQNINKNKWKIFTYFYILHIVELVLS